MVVDVNFFDQVISNMDTPEKVMSHKTTALQNLLGRKLFGGLFSVIQSHQCSEKSTKYVQKLKGARLTMASLDTFLGGDDERPRVRTRPSQLVFCGRFLLLSTEAAN